MRSDRWMVVTNQACESIVPTLDRVVGLRESIDDSGVAAPFIVRIQWRTTTTTALWPSDPRILEIIDDWLGFVGKGAVFNKLLALSFDHLVFGSMNASMAFGFLEFLAFPNRTSRLGLSFTNKYPTSISFGLPWSLHR